MTLRLSATVSVILAVFSVLSAWPQEQSQQEALQQAADFYVNKVRSDPSNLALHRELMDMFSRRGLMYIPVSIYRNSIEEHPTNPTILYVSGYAYLLAAEDPMVLEQIPNPLRMAERNLKAALKERPKSPDALAALGHYYLKAAQPELAVEKWE